MKVIDLNNLRIKLNDIKISEVNNGNNFYDESFYDNLKYFHDLSLGHLKNLQSKVESVFKLQGNYNVKITNVEKNKYKKDIKTQLGYIDEIIEIINSISIKINKLEKISKENYNFINSYVTKKTFKIIDIDLSEIEKSYFNNFLSKNKIFQKHLEIVKSVENSADLYTFEFASYNLYKKFILGEKIKNLFTSLDDVYSFFENKKLVEKLLNTESVLKKHIEKLTKMKSIKIKDFYNDKTLINYLQELSIQEINDELKEYDSKDIKFE